MIDSGLVAYDFCAAVGRVPIAGRKRISSETADFPPGRSIGGHTLYTNLNVSVRYADRTCSDELCAMEPGKVVV
jgi:hypothetical protein